MLENIEKGKPRKQDKLNDFQRPKQLLLYFELDAQNEVRL